jgi:hypothetical protein
MTGVIAASVIPSGSEASPAGWGILAALGMTVKPTTINITIAASFNSISSVCVFVPLRTPRQLMIVSTARVIVASSQSAICRPVSSTV